MSYLIPDAGSKFYRVKLSPEDQAQAMIVSTLFLAYLQNKVEAYASELVGRSLPYESDPKTQMKAILEHERLRNYVDAYDELLAELLEAQKIPNQPE